MRDELDKALVKDFPNLYRQRYGDKRYMCMCWGFTCGDGWEPIIRRLSEKLEKMIIEQVPDIDKVETVNYRDFLKNGHFKSEEELEEAIKRYGIRNIPSWDEKTYTYTRNNNPRHSIYASQVKEKFGTLRFYMSSYLKGMGELIYKAEKESAKTCEVCGNPGILRDTSWLITLCDEHYKNRCLNDLENDQIT